MNAKISYMKPTRNPWWQTAKTPKQGFIRAGVWLFLAVGWVVVAVGDPTPWRWVFAALWTAGGVGYLVSAVLLRRRQRAIQDRGGPEAAVRAD
ncbi:hypothetical protein ABZ422_17085 [Micromonospora zamorensis]|uniref:hypothetical protein n=1 Tax=Micromonospora zamorensis TaxID=709883 RepID=UPI001169596D|nr:hypothetical protein FBZ33_4777 [Micromonospora sp. A202]